MAVTFAVSDTEASREPMPVLARRDAVAALLTGKSTRRIEQVWESDAPLVAATDTNALVQAAHDAFYMHHPLVLSPDAVWFSIAQGFAQHVNANVETLRKRFVRHEGKKTLVVERADFALGRPNPWPEVFAAFSTQIGENVGKLRDLVVGDFSTTGPIERAASEVVLMDAFQGYFEYVVMCGCGIPSVTLLGTPEDWRSIRTRAAVLSEYGLEWWTSALLPVLDALVRTAEGHVDRAFWRSFFRYQSGSGPSELTGWILVLFPYLKKFADYGRSWTLDRNAYLAQWERHFTIAESRTSWIKTPEGPGLGAVPSSLASAPVTVVDVRDGSQQKVSFVGGLFGVVQEPSTLALAPEFGWAVVRDDA